MVALHWLSLVVVSGGYSLQWLLFLRSTGSRHVGFISCGTRAYFPLRMWNLPRPGIKPIFPALAGKFLSTVPPGKSRNFFFFVTIFTWNFTCFFISVNINLSPYMASWRHCVRFWVCRHWVDLVSVLKMVLVFERLEQLEC